MNARNTCLLARLRAPLLLLLLAQAPAVAQDAAPQGEARSEVEKALVLGDDEFVKAVRKLGIGYVEPTLPPGDLWRLMDRIEARRAARGPLKPTEFDLDGVGAFREVAGAIAEAGGPEDYARLLKIYDALPFESRLHAPLFVALSEMWVRRELASLRKAPVKIAISPSAAALPASLREAAPPLAEAWRLYRGALSPFEAAFPPADWRQERPGTLNVQQDWPAFYKALGDVLGGRREGTAARVAAFEWGHWCGTGRDFFEGPKNRAMFLALWKQGHRDLALGALIAAANSGRLLFRVRQEDWPQQFLAACGVPWEKLYAGAALEGHARTLEMGAFGSQESARLLELMAPLPEVASRRDYLQAVAAFVVPPPFSWGSAPQVIAGLRLSSRPAVAPDLQKRLLEILHARMRPDAGLQALDDASEMLKELRRPESEAVLRSALKLPYRRVRQNAYEALKLMRLPVELPAAPEKAGFRVLLDGRPLRDASLTWSLEVGQQGSTSSSGRIDAEGVLHLDRDYLEDTSRKVTAVQLTSAPLQSPSDPWVQARMPVPAALGERTDIALRSQALTLKVEGAPGGAGGTAEARLHAEHHGAAYSHFAPASEWMPLPAGRPVAFAALQRGRYRLEVRAPGRALWKSEDLTLGEQAVEVTASLQKGADVRFELLAPGGEARDRSPEHVLRREGDRYNSSLFFDYLSGAYRGLPAGRYTLKVKPSRERRPGPRAATATWPLYEGEERAFTIDNASPPTIDLGTIALKPAP